MEAKFTEEEKNTLILAYKWQNHLYILEVNI